jgi:putative ABC transport system permease protein
MFRALRITEWFRSFLGDCRFVRRQIIKSPVFTAVATLTLALGIGSSTAIFSVIDGTLLHPYPYKNASRLATIRSFSADQFRAWRFPARAFVDFKELNHTFEDMFGLVYREIHFTTASGTQEVSGASVSPGTFESLGIPALVGRAPIASDFKPEAPPVFVVSYSLWTRFFNRDRKVLGNTYILNGVPTKLIGVMPPRFKIGFQGGCDLWLPIDITRDMYVPGAGIESNEIWTLGHLKPGVTPENAAADLQTIASPLHTDYPIYFPLHFRIVVVTLNSDSVAGDFKLGLFALMGAVIILLFIACSNVANLLLARATTREKEFGIRTALGATRTRIVSQLLLESFALALASCALGCLFALAGLKVILALIPQGTMRPEADVTVSPLALLFSIGATIFVTVACGLAPAVHAIRTDAQVALSGADKGIGVDSRRGGLRSALVVAQVALAIVLTICSGLVLRSLLALESVNLGFDPTKVVYAEISWPEKRYDRRQQKHILLRKIFDHLKQFPGVQAVTETSDFPPYTFGWTTAVIAGRPIPLNRNTASIFCTEGYFQTLGLTLRRGRLFSQSDIDSARHVVIVNDTFVRNHFGEENPIGQQIRFSDYETWRDWPHDSYFEIVGVVSDAKNTGLQNIPRPELYLPDTLAGAIHPAGIMVRAIVDSALILREIDTQISAVDPDVVVSQAGTLATHLDRNYYARPRFLLTTTGTFATIAFLLVSAGIFSVISYNVALQTREIGIRLALGAQRTQVVGLVMQRAARLVLAGIAFGLFASYLLTRLIASEVWGISVTDPTTFVSVAFLALLVGLLACLLPAHRASRIDPMAALRYE